jgi:tyrosinase
MKSELSTNTKKSISSLDANSFSYGEFYKRKGHLQLADTMSQSLSEQGTISLKVRKNIDSLKPTDDEYKLLKTAIKKTMESDQYAKFVTIHSQYMYSIHSADSINQRFLPWHRVFLVEYEKLLNSIMKTENPDKDYDIAIPYWDWEHDHNIPEFYADLTPKKDVQVYIWGGRDRLIASPVVTLQAKRFPIIHPNDPNDPDFKWPDESVVKRIKQNDKYKNFCWDMEAGDNGDGPHGIVHVLAGGVNDNPDPTIPYNLDGLGTMADIRISPLDPLFYSHHANIDRIWSEWQKDQEDKGGSSIYPDLNSAEAILDPWPEYTEPNIRKTEDLGYKYGK